MDFATLSGLIAGIVIIALAVAGGSDFGVFLNLPGFLIVTGGTAAAVFIKFPLKACIESFSEGLKTAFVDRSEQPLQLIKIAIQLSQLVRKSGNLALEDAHIRNRFFKKGTQLIADGHKPDFIRKAMTLEMDQSIERHLVGERVFRAIGESAPAFGMIGTLVGLVQMLANMQDPKSIGIGMAIALLTTLYGSLIAHLFALPIADKLQMRAYSEHTNKALIIEGLVSIQNGQNPKLIEELLISYLPNHEREIFVNETNISTPVKPAKVFPK